MEPIEWLVAAAIGGAVVWLMKGNVKKAKPAPPAKRGRPKASEEVEP